MKDYHINIFYSEVDECYVADIPDLKYCSAFGDDLRDRTQVLYGYTYQQAGCCSVTKQSDSGNDVWRGWSEKMSQ